MSRKHGHRRGREKPIPSKRLLNEPWMKWGGVPFFVDWRRLSRAQRRLVARAALVATSLLVAVLAIIAALVWLPRI